MRWINLFVVGVLLFGFILTAQGQESIIVPVEPEVEEIDWQVGYSEAMALAKEKNAPILLDFYADWCSPCRMMEVQTYTDPRVINALTDYVCIKVDIDVDSRTAYAYGIQSIPRTILLNTYDQAIGDMIGFIDADTMLEMIDSARPLTTKKVEGMSIVNTAVQNEGDLAVIESVDSDTDSNELYEFLSHVNPAVRASALEEVLRRDNIETRTMLVRTLKDEYLGTRIAAWGALKKMETTLSEEYDPWAGYKSCQQAAEKVAQQLKLPVPDTSDETVE